MEGKNSALRARNPHGTKTPTKLEVCPPRRWQNLSTLLAQCGRHEKAAHIYFWWQTIPPGEPANKGRSVTFVRSTFKSSTLVKVCRLHFSCRLPPAQSSPKVPLLAQNEVRDNPHCRELTGTWLPKTAEAAAATLRQNCSRSTASFCWSAPLCTQRVPKFSRMP